jgi:hypothetical protein
MGVGVKIKVVSSSGRFRQYHDMSGVVVGEPFTGIYNVRLSNGTLVFMDSDVLKVVR